MTRIKIDNEILTPDDFALPADTTLDSFLEYWYEDNDDLQDEDPEGEVRDILIQFAKSSFVTSITIRYGFRTRVFKKI